MYKSQTLLKDQNIPHLDETSSETFNSSFSDAYSDSSDLANWEEYVEADGSLFYVEYLSLAKKNTNMQTTDKIEFTKRSLISTEENKEAIRQDNKKYHQSVKCSKIHTKPQNFELDNRNFKFAQIKSSHEHSKQLELVITSADRFRFGRRSTAGESILGFRVVPFTDKQECLMFDGFIRDIPIMEPQSVVKRGDWLKSLNDIDIRTSNLNDLLLQFAEPTKICLKFQGSVRDLKQKNRIMERSYEDKRLKKIVNFAMFSGSFVQLQIPPTTTLRMDSGLKSPLFPLVHIPFALMILRPDCYQHKGAVYYYPEDTAANFLYKARGSFLTLNSVLTKELLTKPLTTKLLIDGLRYLVNYRFLYKFLVVFAYSTQYQTLPESNLRSNELITYMRFALPTLTFDYVEKLNGPTKKFKQFLRQLCEVQYVRLLMHHKYHTYLFEELLQESRIIPLPKEAQLRIFDALSEMEAMDYRNWNDEPLNTHREFFIQGSILYYDCSLLASQMPVELQTTVEGFLRCRGIFDFMMVQTVKEFYVWNEIILPNASGRYFLTICARSHLILGIILKMFDVSDLPQNTTIPPSLFYIEEMQETLKHLIECGIESLAMFWSISNKRPEVLDNVESNVDKHSRKLEFMSQQRPTASYTGDNSPVITNSQLRISHDEDAQPCSSLVGSSIHSLTVSEDDFTRKRMATGNMADDSDSGSDWENFTKQYHFSHSFKANAPTQINASMWNEINNVLPVNISGGWKNSVLYYVYIDNSKGVLFSPLTSKSDYFVRKMRKACHIIHGVLQNTKNIRCHVSDSTLYVAKNISAVKEHGITIEHHNICNQSEVKCRYVVIGRLFHTPSKEIYICHSTDVPQNMVETVFRLSFFSVG